jgi:hypothetical protein
LSRSTTAGEGAKASDALEEIGAAAMARGVLTGTFDH